MKTTYSMSSVSFIKFPECIEKVLKLLKYDVVKVSFDLIQYEDINLELFKELHKYKFPIMLKFVKDNAIPSISFLVREEIFTIIIEGFTDSISNDLQKIFESTLGLTPPTKEDLRSSCNPSDIMSGIWQIIDKLDENIELNKKVSPESTINCFLSFRFDDHSKSLVFELKEFLELCNINVISGLGYEPRSISEKVLNRLSQPIDLFILINSLSGDSAWINQEIGVAKSKNIPILVLNEDGVDEKSSILGDNEYLVFPKNNICKSFIGILQALKYVKRK